MSGTLGLNALIPVGYYNPVISNSSVNGFKKNVVIGYLSASIEWARRKGDPEAWRAWWVGGGANFFDIFLQNHSWHSSPP